MGTKLETRRIMQYAVDHCNSFQRGNLSASVYGSGQMVPKGRLPSFIADQLNARQSAIFVVFSYQTPIGWCNYTANDTNTSEWFIPDVTYSVSTTHHQSLLKVMTANKGFYARFASQTAYSPV